MYIQITTYCNMSCAHCSFSCEKGKKGEHMSRSTFRKAIKLSEERDSTIVLGGGEPTMHPHFWDYFAESMASDVESVWMATNGSITKRALALAEIANGNEKFGIALSQDSFHDPIDKEVYLRFKKYNLEIRNVEQWGIINKGAALTNQVGTTDTECACPETHIEPSGRIRMCGCPDSLVLGHIDSIDDEVFERAYEVGENYNMCGDGLDHAQIRYILDGVEIEEAA